jgi:hypothetical protein
MKKNRFSEEQITYALAQESTVEVSSQAVGDPYPHPTESQEMSYCYFRQ